jgi:hypothetical protein
MTGTQRGTHRFFEMRRGFLSIAVLAAGCGSSGGSPGPDGAGNAGNCAQTTSIARLPACASGATTTFALASGCTPTSDGTLHQEEWSDAACIDVGTGGDVIYAKYAGNDLYMAFSATPACGCGMAFSFDPDGHTAFDGDEFTIDVFDDPFMPDGDRGDFVMQGGNWVSGTAPSGITSACPGHDPTPVNYELTVPFSALGITVGTPHTFRFAMNHPHGGTWPSGASIPQAMTIPVDPSTWGEVSSAHNWR